VINVKLLLTPGEDDDLIALFQNLPPRCKAQTVIAALRGTSTIALWTKDLPDDGDDDEVIDTLEGLIF